ncbi:MAG: hypothetical protein ABI216_21660 [Devosia sp.]
MSEPIPKPDDIPQNVWDVSAAAMGLIEHDADSESIEIIARAILASPPVPLGEAVAWMVTWRPEANGPEWVNTHASEPTAVDEARRVKGVVTPLYTAPQASVS